MIQWLFLGGIGLGVVAAIATKRASNRRSDTSPKVESERPNGVTEDTEQEDPLAWTDRVIKRVSLHEGRYDSVNRNADGAGLSYGMLQWSQKPGSLGVLLSEMHRQHPEAFRDVFGSQWRELLEATSRPGILPVGGVNLWKEPWVSRFIQAGRMPIFQDVQRRLTREGEHFQGALAVARRLNIATERAVALFFDTSVQQGPRAAMKIAEQVAEEVQRSGRTTIGYKDLLELYARRAPAKFRRQNQPSKPYPSSHIEWRKTNGEWHAWAGKFNLYLNILRRRLGILADDSLGDVTVKLANP